MKEGKKIERSAEALMHFERARQRTNLTNGICLALLALAVVGFLYEIGFFER